MLGFIRAGFGKETIEEAEETEGLLSGRVGDEIEDVPLVI